MTSSNSEQVTGQPSQAFEGEDVRPSSRRELLGWYAYGFAAEVFVVCGLGAFIPITLEELARGSATAVLVSDPSQPCRALGVQTSPRSAASEHKATQCEFDLFGRRINTASFALYTFSISVLLQALVIITISGAADHGNYRKRLLLLFAFFGSITTMLFLPVTSAVYLLGSLWAIVGNVCFGVSFVLLNSFLPVLVRHHPAVGGRDDATQVTSTSYYHQVSDRIQILWPCDKKQVSHGDTRALLLHVSLEGVSAEQSSTVTISSRTLTDLVLSTRANTIRIHRKIRIQMRI